MNIIGISGLAGSGKDTVADMLLEREGFVKVSLADPIKRFAKEMWSFTDEQLWGSSEHRSEPDTRYNGLTPRKVLQYIGTEGGRGADSDVWIRYTLATAKRILEWGMGYTPSKGLYWLPELSPYLKAVVIADCRFINEIQYIKKEGGKLIRVVRQDSGLDGDFGTHESEVQMSKIPDNEFDFVIQNNGTLEDLRRKVDQFIDNHIKG